MGVIGQDAAGIAAAEGLAILVELYYASFLTAAHHPDAGGAWANLGGSALAKYVAEVKAIPWLGSVASGASLVVDLGAALYYTP